MLLLVVHVDHLAFECQSCGVFFVEHRDRLEN